MYGHPLMLVVGVPWLSLVPYIGISDSYDAAASSVERCTCLDGWPSSEIPAVYIKASQGFLKKDTPEHEEPVISAIKQI